MDRKSPLIIISQFCYEHEHSGDNLIHRGFIMNGDRYIFDFEYCSKKTGFQQYDTTQDAWYFGTWVNIKELSTVTYAEGDVTVKLLKDAQAMKEELERMESSSASNEINYRSRRRHRHLRLCCWRNAGSIPRL